jgi:hypothetical protein
MDPLGRDQVSKNSSQINPCPELVARAERELSAFFKAISHMFGREQAELSAEDWMREFSETSSLPDSPSDWHSITVKAATRLASRLKDSSLFNQPFMAEPQLA